MKDQRIMGGSPFAHEGLLHQGNDGAGGEDQHPVPRLNDRISAGNDNFVPPEDAQEQGLLGKL